MLGWRHKNFFTISTAHTILFVYLLVLCVKVWDEKFIPLFSPSVIFEISFMLCSTGNSWPLWRYQSFRVHKTEGGYALVWRQILRAVISWSLNHIRALRLCLLLTDNLITIFLLSFLLVIAISPLLTFTPPTFPTLAPFCSPLSLWPLPFASISLLFLPTPTSSSGSVGHDDSAGRTGLEDISCQWGEWNDHFLLYIIYNSQR